MQCRTYVPKERKQHHLSPLLSIILAALPIILLGANEAIAIDHPVDFSSPRLPNPIPEADPRYFISGGLCAAASHGVTTPIDVVKTRMQSEPETFNQGLVQATKDIIETDGAGSLLNGLVPTLLGYGIEGAMKFGLYESLKPTFVQFLSLDDPTEGYLLSSVAAGAVASILLCPMEQTRIRLVTDPTFAGGFTEAFTKLVQAEGIAGVFTGLPAMLSKQVPYTAAKQVSFDLCASLLYAIAASNALAASAVKPEVQVLSAFLASVFACLASHPGDVILTTTYKEGSGQTRGFVSVVTGLYSTNGIEAFFAGLTARFLHVGAIITSQLVLYDIIKQLLGLPATGT